MKNPTVINIKPYHFDWELNSDFSFTLSFYGTREKGKPDNRIKVNITFNWWWLKYFRLSFDKIKAEAQSRVDDCGF